MTCPDESAFASYLARGAGRNASASGEPLHALEAHIDRCPGCRALLSELARSGIADATVVSEPLAGMPGEVQLPIRPGELVAGKYRVDRILGAGGMGIIAAAVHVPLKREVALKFIHPSLCSQPQAVTRFLREARAAASLRSEHVARVLDLGTHESGVPYIVMELLRGDDLRTIVQREGPLPLDHALTYVLQAVEAVAEAHAAGIIHRDLKPDNLFVTRRPDGMPSIKVLDFGVSKITPDVDSGTIASTDSRALLGTPMYMAPEQLIAPADVDARCDVWAMGGILYELLTGTAPFFAESVPQVIARVLHDEPAPPSARQPRLPVELDSIIRCALAKQPQQRFGDIAAFGEALAALAPPAAIASADAARRIIGAQTIRNDPSGPAPREGRSRRRGVAGIVALAAAVAGALVITQASRPEPERPAARMDPPAIVRAPTPPPPVSLPSLAPAPPVAPSPAPAAEPPRRSRRVRVAKAPRPRPPSPPAPAITPVDDVFGRRE